MSSNRPIQSEADAKDFVAELTDEDGVERLRHFVSLLLAENQKQNLISRPSEEQIWQRHLADSAQLLKFVPRETLVGTSRRPWLDLGSGPGLPGLVISILKPDLPVVLVESRARRVEFLSQCVDELRLPNCRIVGARLEVVEPFPASVISARAFAPLDKLLQLSAPFSTKRTVYVLPKGRSAAHELSRQNRSIRKMFHVEQSLTDEEAGIIVSSNSRK